MAAVVTMKSTTTSNEFSQRMDDIPGGYPATELIGVEEGARGEHEDGSQNSAIRSAIWRECATREENGEKRFALKSRNQV